MNKLNEDSQTMVLTQPLDYVVEPEQEGAKSSWFGHIGLIVNLVYAVLFVGIIGYYVDKLIHHSD